MSGFGFIFTQEKLFEGSLLMRVLGFVNFKLLVKLSVFTIVFALKAVKQ